MTALRLRSVRAFVYRAPIADPVTTSFGVMRDRPAVLVRAEDTDGAVGWGEVWCNFPSVGPEHRARLIDSALAALLDGQCIESPESAFMSITQRTEVLALQCGEPGPFAQCIAGIDVALWDLWAQRAGQPLWRMLGGTDPSVTVYASGLNPDRPAELAGRRWADGYRAFKQKLGFGRKRDLANLQALRDAFGPDVPIMADVNQGWTLDEAMAMAPDLQRFGLAWLEEPLRADRPWAEWRQLAPLLSAPLAAGENVAGEAAFEATLASGALGVVQPDLGKWGGFSATAPLARRVLASGLRYCPHWLGGGVGLLASAHLLAAVGGDGMLEVDSNPNPLRSLLCGPLEAVRDGRARLSDAPGLGEPPDLDALRPFLVRH